VNVITITPKVPSQNNVHNQDFISTLEITISFSLQSVISASEVEKRTIGTLWMTPICTYFMFWVHFVPKKGAIIRITWETTCIHSLDWFGGSSSEKGGQLLPLLPMCVALFCMNLPHYYLLGVSSQRDGWSACRYCNLMQTQLRRVAHLSAISGTQ
jgi:hypothetical protein